MQASQEKQCVGLQAPGLVLSGEAKTLAEVLLGLRKILFTIEDIAQSQ